MFTTWLQVGNPNNTEELIKFIGSALIDSLTSLALDKYLKIDGITSGRNSFKAVFKSGLTKVWKHDMNMSLKTLLKGIASKLPENIIGYLLF